MKPFIALVVILSSPPVYGQAEPIVRVFSCIGEGKSEVYPFGVRKTGKHLFRIIDDGQRSTVFRLASTEEKFCAAGAQCSVVNTEDMVEIGTSENPGAPPYSSHFRFHRKTASFEASGGGLDGGWSIGGRDLRDQRRVFGQAGGAIGARHQVGRRQRPFDHNGDGHRQRRAISVSVGAGLQRR